MSESLRERSITGLFADLRVYHADLAWLGKGRVTAGRDKAIRILEDWLDEVSDELMQRGLGLECWPAWVARA